MFASLACQITPTNPNLSPTTGKASLRNEKLSWDVINAAGKDLELLQIDVSWSSNLSATRKLQDIQWPTGTSVATLGGGESTPALVDFSFFPLLLPGTTDGLCGGPECVINMSLTWDDQVLDSETGIGELITIRYHFRDPDGAIGSCEFTVFPDLTIEPGP